MLQREITVKDMLDADMNNNGFLRFVLLFYIFMYAFYILEIMTLP